MPKTIAAIIGILMLATSTFAQSWESLGDAINRNVSSKGYCPAFYVKNTTAYVSFVGKEGSGSNEKIYTMFWNGSTWQQLGDCLNQSPQANANMPAISSFGSGSAVVWSEAVDGRKQLMAKYWRENAWNAFGSTLNTNIGTDKILPAICNEADELYVAEVESNQTPYQLWVKKWSGSEWQIIGQNALNVGDTTKIMAVDPKLAKAGSVLGTAWTEQGFGAHATSEKWKVYVKQWDGEKWALLGNSGIYNNYKCYTQDPSLVVFNGRLVVAWSEYSDENWKVYVRQWNGSAWEKMGEAININNTHDASRPCLAANGSNLAITWCEWRYRNNNVYAKYWDGKTWVLFGEGELNSGENASDPKIALEGETPYVCWTENNEAESRIYMKTIAGGIPTTTPTVTPTHTPTPTVTPTMVCKKYEVKILSSRFDPTRGQATTIQWYVEKSSPVSIKLYSLAGEFIKTLVDNQVYEAGGPYTVQWKGGNLHDNTVASGIYVVLIEAGEFKQWQKIAVVKK